MKKIIPISVMFLLLLLFQTAIMAQHNTNTLNVGGTLESGQWLISNNGRYKATMGENGRLTLVDLAKNRTLWIHQIWDMNSYKSELYNIWLKDCYTGPLDYGNFNYEYNVPPNSLVKPFSQELINQQELLKKNNKSFEFLFYMAYLKSFSSNTRVDPSSFHDFESVSYYGTEFSYENPTQNIILEEWPKYLSGEKQYINAEGVSVPYIYYLPFQPTQTEPLVVPGSKLLLRLEGLSVSYNHKSIFKKYEGTSDKYFLVNLWGVITPNMKNVKLIMQDDGNLVLYGDILNGASADLSNAINHMHFIKRNIFVDDGNYCNQCVIWATNTATSQIQPEDELKDQAANITVNNTNYAALVNEVQATVGYLKISNSKYTQKNQTLGLWSGKYVELLPGFEANVSGNNGLIKIASFAMTPSKVNPVSKSATKTKQTITKSENSKTSSTSLANNKLKSILTIFPNPTDGIVNITLSSPTDEVRETRVYDIAGNLILTTLNKNTVDLSSKPSGAYIIDVTTNFEKFTKKIIKK